MFAYGGCKIILKAGIITKYNFWSVSMIIM